MAGRPLGAENKDKPYREALRRAIARAEDADKPHTLDRIADRHLMDAAGGDMQAIKELADRIDGRPAQESSLTIDDKRDASDWTRSELVAFLNDARARGDRTSEADGRTIEPDSVH